jgi:hypothetical protein
MYKMQITLLALLIIEDLFVKRSAWKKGGRDFLRLTK